MFKPNSRYANASTDRVPVAGRMVDVVRFPTRTAPPLLGYHATLDGQTLDQLAAYYLKDPTRFWSICDVNGAPSPHALRVRSHIGIPGKER
jgi:hypothetical protein